MEDDGLLPEPAGWKENVCVACQRENADKEGGNEGLLRFELQRGTPLKKAAKLAYVTMAVARGVHAGMVHRGEVEDPQRKEASRNGSTPHEPRNRQKTEHGTWSPHREEIERALRADHKRPDAEVAQDFGVTQRTVVRARERLGLPSEPTRLERDAELLRQLGPSATAEAFAERIGTQVAGARSRLRKLAAAGLATVEVGRDGRGARQRHTARTPSAP
jgi:hypothetical protein